MTASDGQGSLRRAANYDAPLTTARRSGEGLITTGGSGGNMKPACEKRVKAKPGPFKLEKIVPYQFSVGTLST
jgi:hypothetical protein